MLDQLYIARISTHIGTRRKPQVLSFPYSDSVVHEPLRHSCLNANVFSRQARTISWGLFGRISISLGLVEVHRNTLPSRVNLVIHPKIASMDIFRSFLNAPGGYLLFKPWLIFSLRPHSVLGRGAWIKREVKLPI
jgi:hypothetical protein